MTERLHCVYGSPHRHMKQVKDLGLNFKQPFSDWQIYRYSRSS